MARTDWHLTWKEKENRDRSFDTSRIYIAEVMDTRNITHAGELKVWIVNSGIDKTDKSKWVTASYCSPFYGTTPYQQTSDNSFEQSPKSFGSWFPIPYVGNYVFIFYACTFGENVEPYWFGSPVDGDTNFMLPGIPKSYTNDEKGSLCEINNRNEEFKSRKINTLVDKETRQTEYAPINNALKKQGLEKDKLRGYSTAGSKRESPSMCYGIVTPLGNTFTIDDGWENEDNRHTWKMDSGTIINPERLIDDNGKAAYQYEETHRKDAGFRFRTRNGTQLLISDNGNIYMINREGTAWAEISDDGRLQGYAKTSADIACDGDINFKSKKKIIMEADEGFALKSQKGMSIELGGDLQLSTPHIQSDAIVNTNEINANIGNIESFQSNMVQANGVFSGTLQGTAYYATTAGIISIEQPLPTITPVELPEVIVEPIKMIPGRDGETQMTINTFAPTAEPYDGHDCNKIYPKLDVNKKPYQDNSQNDEMTSNEPITNQVCCKPNEQPKDEVNQCLINEEKLSENYTLRDLCASSSADNLGINNNPSNESIIEKLKTLCNNVLEPITKHYGSKVIINSGYRSYVLNQAIGGSTTSQHSTGEAVDIEVSGVSTFDLAEWIRDNLGYDQLILEYADNLLHDPNCGWVHISYVNETKNRKQVWTINKNGTKSGLSK